MDITTTTTEFISLADVLATELGRSRGSSEPNSFPTTEREGVLGSPGKRSEGPGLP